MRSLSVGHALQRRQSRSPALGAASLILVVVVWQIATGSNNSPYAILPSPSSIFAALMRPGPNAVQLITELPSDIALTVSHALLGLALGFATGLPTGLAMSRWRSVKAMLDPYVTAFNALPRIALLPILVIAFGFGSLPGLMLIWSAAFVVVVLNTVVGVRSVQQTYVDHVRVLGASSIQVTLLVVMPTILPWLIAALRLGIGFAFTTAILAETSGVNAGLGYLLVWYEGQAFAPGEFLVVALVTVLALILDGAIGGVQWLAVHWPTR